MRLLLILLPALWAQRELNVADTPAKARTPKGEYISWKEHLIDDQQLGGVPIRGADGLQFADFDKDGLLDIVSVHEDSDHIRLAFGSRDPDKWTLVTLAGQDEAKAAEDSAVGDVNGDGYPDIIAACELAHLIYFQNPGREARTRRWPRVILANTRNRGSFIRVFLADLDQDGKIEAIGVNKGEQLPTAVPGERTPDADRKKLPISIFRPGRNPLDANGWKEEPLIRFLIPINAPPVDLDGDGDLDIVAGSRGESRMVVLENVSRKPLKFEHRPVRIEGLPAGTPDPWGFMIAFHDLSGDGKLDMVVHAGTNTLHWLEQPASLTGAWKAHRIGTIHPDVPTGITVADFNGDGRSDVITGGYSQAPREHDGPEIGRNSVCGRIAWFENTAAGAWVRHDVQRTKRGMYDAFLVRDMDGDGDPDVVGTRGNSGNFDGVYWLEQVRTPNPATVFRQARAKESAPLPLPAER